MRRDTAIGNACQLFNVRAQFFRAECAIESDRNRVGVAHRVVERFHYLPRQRAARCIGDGAGNHDRQTHFCRQSPRIKLFFNRKYCGLAIERVEDGFNQQNISTSVDEPTRGLPVSVLHFIKVHCAKPGVIYIRRQRQRAVHRA